MFAVIYSLTDVCCQERRRREDAERIAAEEIERLRRELDEAKRLKVTLFSIHFKHYLKIIINSKCIEMRLYMSWKACCV